MGVIRRTVRFGSEDGSTSVAAEALIDTGAVHCQVPASVAEQFRARLFHRARILLADGSVQERDIVHLQVELDLSLPPVPTTVVVGDEGCPFLVGVVVLEQLGVGIDPATQQLVRDLPALLMSTNWPTL